MRSDSWMEINTFPLAQVQLDIGEILKAISPTHSRPYAPPRHSATIQNARMTAPPTMSESFQDHAT